MKLAIVDEKCGLTLAETKLVHSVIANVVMDPHVPQAQLNWTPQKKRQLRTALHKLDMLLAGVISGT